MKKYHPEERYGLVRRQGKAADYRFFIPMLILMTGNLWGGISTNYSGTAQVFAVARGFIFTFVFYKSGSLVVCIFVHGMVDAFSKFAVYAEDMTSAYIYMFATMAVAVIYCLYLSRKPTVPERE